MADEQIIFSMERVTKTVASNKAILKNINLSFFYGAKIGVLGLNGAGKSTLLRIIAGEDEDYEGRIEFDGSYKIGFLHQEPILDEDKTVRQVVEEGVAEIMQVLHEYEELNMKFGSVTNDQEMADLIAEQGRMTEWLEKNDAWDIGHKVDIALDALNCPPDETPVNVLSGGEKRRVAMARLLLSKPDILLLDEPTNHLDVNSVAWLEQYLKNFPGTVITVTHDRYFLNNIAGWILELDNGEGVPWKGNYTSWLTQKIKKLENQGKKGGKNYEALKKELEWVQLTPEEQKELVKQRLHAYDSLYGGDGQESVIAIPEGPRLGNKVIELTEVEKGFAGRLLIDNLSFNVPRSAIVGIIGPNGVGKTTLFKLLVGDEKPDSGTIIIGDTVKISYVDQHRSNLNEEDTVFHAVAGGSETIETLNGTIKTRAYLSKFNFTGKEQSKKVRDLSGGERNRLNLALTLKDGGNVLLLDEPSNDIDVNTLRALEVGIQNFAGCVLVTSHDRWFINRIATHILAFEGGGRVRFFEGNYMDYAEQLEDDAQFVEDRKRFKNLMEF